jgi:hypothetical protein
LGFACAFRNTASKYRIDAMKLTAGKKAIGRHARINLIALSEVICRNAINVIAITAALRWTPA